MCINSSLDHSYPVWTLKPILRHTELKKFLLDRVRNYPTEMEFEHNVNAGVDFIYNVDENWCVLRFKKVKFRLFVSV
jgi:hypothetical protein